MSAIFYQAPAGTDIDASRRNLIVAWSSQRLSRSPLERKRGAP
jgi:hypothetical protein